MNEQTITFPSNVDEKYLRYPRKVLNGNIIACDAIKKQCMRYLSWFNRTDMYFSPKSCDKVVNFVQRFKLSSCGNKQFLLTECQRHIIYSIYGFKWKKNGLRVVKECFIQVARKAGKDAFMAALSLYMLIVDGEASPEIACLANSREQARILFDYITNFGKSIDPKSSFLKYYRNYVKVDANNGTIKVFSADASKLDGLNISFAIIDEYHEAKDRKIYEVIK